MHPLPQDVRFDTEPHIRGGEGGEPRRRVLYSCHIRTGDVDCMAEIASYADCDALLGIVNASYLIDGRQIHLHRDLIGRVYFIDGPDRRTVLKLYRPIDTNAALRTTSILRYLEEKAFPAASIVPTTAGDLSIFIDGPEGRSVGILFHRVNGTEPNIETEIEGIGLQVARLHNLMKGYPYDLTGRIKAQYIDEYIAIMNELNYTPKHVAALAEYGDELWERLKQFPRGFCHGDMHTGNMLQTGIGSYVLFDFVEACHRGDYAFLRKNTRNMEVSDKGLAYYWAGERIELQFPAYDWQREVRRVRGVMRLKQDELTVICETSGEASDQPTGVLHISFVRRQGVWKVERIGTDI